jgi:hypothetical protein
MLKNFVQVLFLLSQVRNDKTMYYKMAVVNGDNGCVQAKISSKMSKKIKAKPGTCSQVYCYEYKGKAYIPFCCGVEVYACTNFVSYYQTMLTI